MLLFLDTETTGLYHYDKRSDDPAQPKIVELAALLTDDTGKEYGAFNVLIDHGIEIPAEATTVHGITREDCATFGVSLERALSSLEDYTYRGRCSIIGHNIAFDLKMIRAAHGSEWFDKSFYKFTPTYCTMLKSTNICKIPKAKGNGWKWPTLTQALYILCNEVQPDLHRAMADVRACKEVYFKLKEMGL